MQMENKERLVEIVRRFAGQRVVIVGDTIADKFVHGSISRVSREAPVFILKHEQTQTLPGGAANCAMNLVALGAHVSLISVVGNDESGHELRAKLQAAGVDINRVIVSEKVQTTTKVRILAGQSHSNKQQVIRIDYEGGSLNDEELRAAILLHLKIAILDAKAIVISDYNYGVIDTAAAEVIRKKSDVPVLVDSRFRLLDFTGFTAATPNEDEVENLVGMPITAEGFDIAAQDVKKKLGHRALLVTRGAQGMALLEGDTAPLHIPAAGEQQAVDVTGAGDTVIATFSLALASGASFTEAAHLANYAGGLVVMKRGTATISTQELEHTITGLHD
jgi:rfaE bifunctional protein kinase chain/domain